MSRNGTCPRFRRRETQREDTYGTYMSPLSTYSPYL